MGNEQSTQKHEPRPEIAPQRSAMSRTRSVQNRLSGDDEHSRYLPKGLSKQQQHDIVGSSNGKRVDSLADAGSLESPQWGVSTIRTFYTKNPNFDALTFCSLFFSSVVYSNYSANTRDVLFPSLVKTHIVLFDNVYNI